MEMPSTPYLMPCNIRHVVKEYLQRQFLPAHHLAGRPTSSASKTSPGSTGARATGFAPTALLTISLLLTGLFGAGAALAQSPPLLTSDSELATAGNFRLSWQTTARSVELQQADNAEFVAARTVYRGPDRAMVVSGKPDGDWYFRVRSLNTDQAGSWSDPVKVTVSHHSLGRALAFLLLGFVVFVATIALIARGTGKTE